MPPVIDFAKLSLQDALDLAILIEEEAKERYEEFAHQLGEHHTPEAAAFFRTMAANETRHGEDLSLRRQDLFGDAPTAVTRAMLWDIEAPDYDQSRMFMSVHQAIEVALDCEIKAHDFFDNALKYVKDAEVRRLLEELREEEKEHQRLVKAVMAKLPPSTSVGEPDDFADEPVGH
jgi:erythrin-vacuolar iron transport family protein